MQVGYGEKSEEILLTYIKNDDMEEIDGNNADSEDFK